MSETTTRLALRGAAASIPDRFGACLLAPGRTRFRLWAPAQDSVAVEIEPDRPGARRVPMQAGPDGWFEVQVDCGAGTRYRYGLGSGQSVPDPASRMQDGDVHDASVVVDPAAYRWRQTRWRGRPWSEAVIYELHVGAFGGFDGVRAQLPRLAKLGITAVELMPVADFPGARNWGYDGVLPYAPDRAYGTPEQLKALVDEAHGLGLMVFLDVVYNHFGPDGNYLHAYAPAFFREDMHTPWGPAIDFRRAQVRDFFTGNAAYWLRDYRFDGLRFDAAHAIAEQDWLEEMAHVLRQATDRQRHVHLVLEHDDNAVVLLEHEFDAQWNDDGHHVLHRLLTGENQGYYGDYDEQPAALLARCLAQGFAYQGECSAHRGGVPRGRPSAHLPPTSFVLFLQNHDQIGNRARGERLLALLRAQGRTEVLRAAVALVLLAPQIPLIFMGEEYGVEAPFLYFTSHGPELAQAVREGRRREFAGFAEFADEAARAAIPDPNEAATFEASRHGLLDRGAAQDWPDYYGTLLRCRRDALVPSLDAARAIGAQALGEQAVWARWSLGDGRLLALYANFGDAAVPAPTPADAAGLLFESRAGAAGELEQGSLAAVCTLAWIEEGAS
ncbi:Malto-oligosyltrehalose trehalohydrolase [Pigmentiphaga humi]|uniref:Malto-oligosyltrehalose trehalohydrolase n=1 Tax=Pigmentiphaga humi TaxID=2478468 RepID=A0A3P4B520_9BURK|nr:malto-oligosyltrehalose trehalohydrolase [Pigmentiphaga humi]VCU70760.1 Malto-oligosyltrehalose trehalohydrolase [Pigmentiphaga humi]